MGSISESVSGIRAEPTTIVSGTTTDEIVLGDRVLVGVVMPSGIASTTMTVLAATAAGGTFVTMQDGVGQYGPIGDITFTIAASKHLTIPPAMTSGITFIKLVFGSSETARTFETVTRDI